MQNKITVDIRIMLACGYVITFAVFLCPFLICLSVDLLSFGILEHLITIWGMWVERIFSYSIASVYDQQVFCICVLPNTPSFFWGDK